MIAPVLNDAEFQQELKLRIDASPGGRGLQTIASGVRHADGSALFEPGCKPVPIELMDAFNRYLAEFGLCSGTWNYKIGAVDYQIHFVTSPVL